MEGPPGVMSFFFLRKVLPCRKERTRGTRQPADKGRATGWFNDRVNYTAARCGEGGIGALRTATTVRSKTFIYAPGFSISPYLSGQGRTLDSLLTGPNRPPVAYRATCSSAQSVSRVSSLGGGLVVTYASFERYGELPRRTIQPPSPPFLLRSVRRRRGEYRPPAGALHDEMVCGAKPMLWKERYSWNIPGIL